MRILKGTVLVLLAATVAGCADKQMKTVDRFVDSKDLSTLQAGIWIDPNGCDHWIIDDGFEGYLSQRLDPKGKPVCSGAGPSNTAIGNFKGGSSVADTI